MTKQRMVLIAMLSTLAHSSPAEVPIACNINALSSGQRQELKHFSERIASAVVGTREMSDGYAFQVNSAMLTAVDLAGGIDLWRRCCPFYEFQIDLRGEDGGLWLSLRGRKGVKEYFPIDAPKLAEKLPKRVSR